MSTLAEQVVEQLKTDMDNAYDAGYQKGVSETDGYGVGYGDGQAHFGTQNEVTGTNIVTCDYVNENEHNVEVKLSSDTVTDFSGVEVKCIGKNLYDSSYRTPTGVIKCYRCVVEENNGVFSITPTQQDIIVWKDGSKPIGQKYDAESSGCLIPIPNGATKIYFKLSNPAFSKNYISLYDENKISIDGGTYPSSEFSHTIKNGVKYCTLRFGIENVVIGETYETTVMVNVGGLQDYEPYTEKIYTANADGTVDGVTSISPTMNLICNTEGVDISAKYYCVQDVEWHRFWDGYQNYGTKTNYNRTFNNTGWTDDIFKPKYSIIPQYANYMFWQCGLVDNPYLKSIDFSKAVDTSYCFNQSTVEHVGIIDTRACKTLVGIFHSANKLHTIDKIIFAETQSLNTNIFQNAIALENICVEGTIGQSISFRWSTLLSHDSIANIFDVLSSDVTDQTLTLSLIAVNNAFETSEGLADGSTSEEWLNLVATKTNWTVSLI